MIPFILGACGQHQKVPAFYWTSRGMESELLVQGEKKMRIRNQLASKACQSARLPDVIVPLGAVAVGYESPEALQESDSMLTYEIVSKREDVEHFYAEEMILEGWRLVARIQGAECLLIFDKPQRVCTVSLRDIHKSQKIAIIIAHAQKKPGV